MTVSRCDTRDPRCRSPGTSGDRIQRPPSRDGAAGASPYDGRALWSRDPAERYCVNPAFETYRLAEEHTMLREAVRALAEDKIAPRAAEVDATGEFPWDVFEALKRSELLAIHVPEEYGGPGAD